MTPHKASRNDRPAPDRSPQGKAQDPIKPETKPARAGNRPAIPVTDPGCIIINGKGSCPEWEGLLKKYPMIDSVQREDFWDPGASFAYLAHFYRTGNTAEESARAQEDFLAFFQAIGYVYNYSGNFESRWFEGIGVQVR
jgi:hypothetical protein